MAGCIWLLLTAWLGQVAVTTSRAAGRGDTKSAAFDEMEGTTAPRRSPRVEQPTPHYDPAAEAARPQTLGGGGTARPAPKSPECVTPTVELSAELLVRLHVPEQAEARLQALALDDLRYLLRMNGTPSGSMDKQSCVAGLVHLINTTGLKAGSARPASLARVPMWNRKDSRKISGRAAPLEANVTVSSSVVCNVWPTSDQPFVSGVPAQQSRLRAVHRSGARHEPDHQASADGQSAKELVARAQTAAA